MSLKCRKMTSWLAVFIWMLIIFYLSHQPATASSQLSSGLTVWIIKTTELIFSIEIDKGGFHFIIRKLAHFLAYLILGVFMMNALRVSFRVDYWNIGLALAICLLYAISDEVHQLFISGRSGELTDVLIDSTGATVGIAITIHVSKIKRKLIGRIL